MAEQHPDLFGNKELEEFAMSAQLAARARPATEKNSLLLTTALRNTDRADPVAVLALSGSQEEAVQRSIRRRSHYGRDSEPPSEKEARRGASYKHNDQTALPSL
jgi:hypothetical protein